MLNTYLVMADTGTHMMDVTANRNDTEMLMVTNTGIPTTSMVVPMSPLKK